MPQRNLEILLDDFAPGCPVVDLSQVHGRHVAVAAPGEPRPQGDGLVTDRPDVVLLVRAADCVPVLFADPAAGVLGAAHAGRAGVAAGVVPATVQAMRDLGAADVTAWIGPHVCGACYEVPVELQDEVADAVPATRATTSWGSPSLDLGAGVRAQLEADGVRVLDVSACTRESPDLYSYRRDGAGSGRLAGLIRRAVAS